MMSKRICVVDYGMGNLRSVAKAAEVSGAAVKVTSSYKEISKSDVVILPGVGSFDAAVKNLKRIKLWYELSDIIEKKHFLGICLGLQLLFEKSEEGSENGLGIFKGSVKKFRLKNNHVPHMGWNTVRYQMPVASCQIFRGVKEKSNFYFVHSYYVKPEDENIIAATTSYGVEFCSAVYKDNIFACQFHPEKSGGVGLKLIKNFLTFNL